MVLLVKTRAIDHFLGSGVIHAARVQEIKCLIIHDVRAPSTLRASLRMLILYNHRGVFFKSDLFTAMKVLAETSYTSLPCIPRQIFLQIAKGKHRMGRHLAREDTSCGVLTTEVRVCVKALVFFNVGQFDRGHRPFILNQPLSLVIKLFCLNELLEHYVITC